MPARSRTGMLMALWVAGLLVACSSGTSPSATPAAATPTSIPTATADATPTPTTPPTPTGSPQSAAPSPRPTPISSPRPTPAPTQAAVHWRLVGRVPTGSNGSIDGVERLNDGYVAWGSFGNDADVDAMLATWFSADGRTWERTVHAKSIVPCPGWTARPNLESVYAPAFDGNTLVLAATLLIPDADACDRAQMVSLSTTDGRHWVRSQPFSPPRDDPAWAVWSERTWAVPGGWETLVETGGAVVTIWRSADLVTWSQVAARDLGDTDADPSLQFHVVAAAVDGTRLAVSTKQDGETSRSTLLSSVDALSWKVVRVLPPGFSVMEVVPPQAPGREWLVAVARDDPEQGQVLLSQDLVTWKGVVFPTPGIGNLVAKKTGWAAVGYWPARETGCGDSCRAVNPSWYTSRNGRTWISRPLQLPSATASLLGVDGSGAWAVDRVQSKAGNVTLWRVND
jgi:hypothetical protein